VRTTRAFIESVWSLGPTPTFVDAAALARTTVFATDFSGLPPIPEFIVSQFVNVRSTVSPNNTMLIVLPLNVSGSSDAAEQDVRILRQMVFQHVGAVGSDYGVYVSGDPALTVDIMDAVDRDTSKIDFVTVFLVVVLVGMFFRSAVTPWVPLMTVGMAFMTSTAIIYILGSYLLEIHYSVMTIVLTVMLGAGTDYCIFIMSRYREERVLGRSKEDSVRTSLTWAGESITTSGATVMIGFGALMIGQYTLVRSMGMALVVAVGIALAFALTMLPSLLMLIGDKVFWPQPIDREVKRARRKEERGGGYFRKSAQFSLKNRRAIVVAAVLISLPAAYLVLSLESSYDFIAGLPEADSKKGIDALAEGFGEGTIMPTYVLIRYDDNVTTGSSTALTSSAWDQVETYCVNLLAQDNVRSVSGPTRPFGVTANASYIASLPEDERATYEYGIAQTIGSDNRTVMLTVTLQDEPFTTKSIHTMDDIRKMNRELARSVFDGKAEILVGGSTAAMKDVSVTVSNDFFTMRIVVLIGIYFVLMFVLGSLVIPLRLILTVLLSVSWTIAMTMIIFQFASGVPVLWMMPLILFVVAMGLGMDYDIFLTTRIREEVSKGKTDEQAIMTAVERTGGIITACGVVMAGAFGSMLLSSTALLREFGFGLSFAILLDAMVVRIYLVPAIMLMLQKWNWYAPGRLQRVRRDEKARKH
ncbi:MAG: MMPL family transporter, partial [Thermoplasmata archaeon]